MARACISGDRKRLRSVMSPTQIESEQSYRDRRVATNRAVRLPLAFNRLEDVLLRKQANYKHVEPVYKSRDAATRQVNVKFEEATAIVQLIADRQRRKSDAATLNFDLEDARSGRREDENHVSRLRRRHENHRVVINKSPSTEIRAPSFGSRDITALQAKVTDVEQELLAIQHDDLEC